MAAYLKANAKSALFFAPYSHRCGVCTYMPVMIPYVGWARRTQGTRGGPLMGRPRWPLTELTAV